MRHHLYRHFDKNGELLYVGISLSHLRRLWEHGSKSGWFAKIATVTIEQCGDVSDARIKEIDAIRNEHPKYNKTHVLKIPVPKVKLPKMPPLPVTRLRCDLGLTQEQFWNALGITQSGGSRYEKGGHRRGGNEIPQPVKMLIAIAYGTDTQREKVLAGLRFK